MLKEYYKCYNSKILYYSICLYKKKFDEYASIIC